MTNENGLTGSLPNEHAVSERILVIDDDRLIRRALSDYLTDCGYEIVQAADGVEGVAQARAGQFNAVLVDLRMPNMGGLEVISVLHTEQPELPLVVVSGTGILSDAIEAMRRGADDYIAKPIKDRGEIAVVVERVLEKARLRAERDRYQHELEQLNHSLEAEVDRQTRDLRVKNRELTALNSVSSAINDPLDVSTMLDHAIDAAVIAIEADGGVVRLLDHESGKLVITAARGLPESCPASDQGIPMGQGFIGRVAQSGNSCAGGDLVDDPWMTIMKDEGFHSYLCVPLRAGDADTSFIDRVSLAGMGKKRPIVGTLEIAVRAEREFDEREVSLLIGISNQIGVALTRARYAADLKRANTRLEHLVTRIQEQAQRMQQIVDTVPEGVLMLNDDRRADGQVHWRIVLANPMAEQNLPILGDARVGDILSRLGDRLLTELLTPLPQGLWHEVAVDGKSFQAIARPVGEGNFASVAYASGQVTEADSMPDEWMLVIRDVTQQREFNRRVQLQERLAAVGQLAAGIAHDFNNIMATIVLYAQITSHAEGLSDHIRERMATINRQAKHATDLIRQILDFSRRAVLERQPFDLLPFLKEQVNLLERTLPENIEIALSYGSDEYTVNADPTRIQQMVMNLALNARDAMPEGGKLRIGLEWMRIEDGEAMPLPEMEFADTTANEWVQITVADTGMGIPPDVMPHIFDPFFTTKSPGQGTGLGLAQVHGIVGSHEGAIDVETWLDAEGERSSGTTFTTYLPALSSHPPEAEPLEIEPLATGQGEIILVVEDDESAREALAESLELLNYRVLDASDGQEALAILEQSDEQISLVLSDAVMPGMGGVALLRSIQERAWTIPVVMLTGHPLDEELDSLREHEFSSLLADWLHKPVSLTELAQVIARVLGNE